MFPMSISALTWSILVDILNQINTITHINYYLNHMFIKLQIFIFTCIHELYII